MTVTGEGGERLDAGWVPGGFVLRDRDEANLGGSQGVDYAPADRTKGFAEILRLHSTGPLSGLMLGSRQNVPVEVQGHAGIVNDAPGPPDAVWVAWTMAPGLELEVQGYHLAESQVLQIANSVRYQPAAPFGYPVHPDVSVTRDHALATLGTTHAGGHAALTSVGELDSVRQRRTNHRSTLLHDLAVTRPIWVLWTAGSATDQRANVIDAKTGSTLTTMTIDSAALDALTDRSDASCVPPYGVLTRSEAAYISPPAPGATLQMKLTTQGALAGTPGDAFYALRHCDGDLCDPRAPVWIVVRRARDHRFTECLNCGSLVGVTGPGGPTGPTTTLEPGSWQMSAFDARTGPLSVVPALDGGVTASGAGTPPAYLLALPDFAPQ